MDIKELEKELDEGRQYMQMYFNGEQTVVIQKLSEKQHVSLTHAMGLGLARVYESLLTFKRQYYKMAIEALKHAADFAAERRKVSDYFWKSTDYDAFTDEECIAEVYYAVSLCLLGLVSVSGRSLYAAVQAGLKIRNGHRTAEFCNKILKHRTKWESEKVKMHFESIVSFTMSIFHLTLSFASRRLSLLLELFGFQGDRELGVAELHKTFTLENGLSYEVASLSLSFYYGFLQCFFLLGDSNAEFFEQMNSMWSRRAPNSIFYKIQQALGCMRHGKLETGIQLYTEIIENNNDLIQLQYPCYFGLAVAYGLKGQWEMSVKYSKVLHDECRWSPALFAYMYACALQGQMMTTGNMDLKEEISEALRKVSKKKRHLGGKLVFHEKLVLLRAKTFENKVEEMVLPFWEICYIFNGVACLAGNKEVIQAQMDQIQAEMSKYSKDNVEIQSYLLFMMSVCHKLLAHYHKALYGFEEVINKKKQIVEETNLVPQSYFEIGMIYRTLNKKEEAVKYLKKARDNYSGYLTETMIKYRSEVALESLKNL